MLETSNFVQGSAMQSLSLVMSEYFLSGRGQGHVTNFYIVDLENFATASRWYTGDIHNSTVVSLFMTHCLQLNLQLHTIGLVRTCHISSFCTVAWWLARLLLTRRITQSLGDSWASCSIWQPSATLGLLDACLDHPRWVLGVSVIVQNLVGIDAVVLSLMWVSLFCMLGLKMPIHAAKIAICV